VRATYRSCRFGILGVGKLELYFAILFVKYTTNLRRLQAFFHPRLRPRFLVGWHPHAAADAFVKQDRHPKMRAGRDEVSVAFGSDFVSGAHGRIKILLIRVPGTYPSPSKTLAPALTPRY